MSGKGGKGEIGEKGKKLVVLDINGILCCKYFICSNKNKYGEKDKTDRDVIKSLIKLPCLDLPKFIVFLRPHVKEFLDFCFLNYDVGFFSSTTEKNAGEILSVLLSDVQKKKVKFFWYRDRTRLDPDYGKDSEIKNFDTVKLLDDIIESPMINYERKYNENNIFLLDDSEKKTRFNNSDNVIIIPSFDMKLSLDELITTLIQEKKEEKKEDKDEDEDEDEDKNEDKLNFDKFYNDDELKKIREKLAG